MWIGGARAYDLFVERFGQGETHSTPRVLRSLGCPKMPAWHSVGFRPKPGVFMSIAHPVALATMAGPHGNRRSSIALSRDASTGLPAILICLSSKLFVDAPGTIGATRFMACPSH